MIGVKIIEVNTEYCGKPVITIEFPNGKIDSFDGYYGYWCLNMDNYLNFSEWLSKYDFDEEKYFSSKYWYFCELLDLYYWEK